MQILFLWLMALVWARNPYQPHNVTCPSTPIMREATERSDRELAYVHKRQVQTNQKLNQFLKRINLVDFDVDEFMSTTASHNITIGIAFSGGGFRAMFLGAGQLLAFDDRFEDSQSKALGGIVQSATYISGLSGGSWLLGSLVLNEFPSVYRIVNRELNIWNVQKSILDPYGLDVIKNEKYYSAVGKDVAAKHKAGFGTSITDFWGRMLEFKFVTSTDGGDNVTWSSIVDAPFFKNHDIPYPFFVTDGRYNGTEIINLNSTVFEITPHELGSWDPSVKLFVDLKYLGTNMVNGKPINKDSCVVNYDNAGFLMGTSSSLFNAAVLRFELGKIKTFLIHAVDGLLDDINLHVEVDVAVYSPNPFYKSEFGDSSNLLNSKELHLVDGSEDTQNIALYPLVQRQRHVDVIFSCDNSGDTNLFPDGTSIISTFKRQFETQGKSSLVPYVPTDHQVFLDEGLNERPVFFGCYADEMQEIADNAGNGVNTTDIPLIIYLANHEVTYASNVSTFKLLYTEAERDGLIANGFGVASNWNMTKDKDWAKCVGCAVIRRNQERFGIEQTDECKQCFSRYCWSRKSTDKKSSNVNAPDPSSTSKKGSTLLTSLYGAAAVLLGGFV